jgi:hypothetical protein
MIALRRTDSRQTDTASDPFFRVERRYSTSTSACSDSAYETLLSETLAKITDCLRLKADWDGEDALPISAGTGNMARDLVMQVANGIGQRKQWVTPSVSPDPNGRLHLLWRMESHRLLLIVDGANPKEVVSVVTTPDVKPVREVISLPNAVQRVLAALPPK